MAPTEQRLRGPDRGQVFIDVAGDIALNSSPVLISAFDGSQNFVLDVACAVGIFNAGDLADQAESGSQRRLATRPGRACTLDSTRRDGRIHRQDVHWIPLAGRTLEKVDSASAAPLASVSERIPSRSETIVSQLDARG
jgi:hypothetical protein